MERIRSSEIRDYLRHLLDAAYNAMATATDEATASAPALADDPFIMLLHQALQERNFESTRETLAGRSNAGARPDRGAQRLSHEPARGIAPQHQGHADRRLCWAVAIDAALLDAAMKRDAQDLRRQRPPRRADRYGPLLSPQRILRWRLPRSLQRVRPAPLADHHLLARSGHRPAEYRRLVQPQSRSATGGFLRLRHRADQL